MEMLTADCNLFFCSCIHKHMWMQAFVSFPDIERSTGITAPPSPPRSVACTQMFPSVWIKDSNVKTSLHYSVVSYSTILSEQIQSPEIASSRILGGSVRKQKLVQREWLLSPALFHVLSVTLLVCFRPTLSMFLWISVQTTSAIPLSFLYLCINNFLWCGCTEADLWICCGCYLLLSFCVCFLFRIHNFKTTGLELQQSHNIFDFSHSFSAL